MDNTLRRTLDNNNRSIESQNAVFGKFEKFFYPYYSDKLAEFDVIIDNNDWSNNYITRDRVGVHSPAVGNP